MSDSPIDLLQGTVDVLILRTLAWEPMHGYGVSRFIRERTEGVLTIESAALYQALHRLERKKWVRAEWGVSENNRRAKFYSITTEGRKQLRAGDRDVAHVRRSGVQGARADMMRAVSAVCRGDRRAPPRRSRGRASLLLRHAHAGARRAGHVRVGRASRSRPRVRRPGVHETLLPGGGRHEHARGTYHRCLGRAAPGHRAQLAGACAARPASPSSRWSRSR